MGADHGVGHYAEGRDHPGTVLSAIACLALPLIHPARYFYRRHP